MPKTRNRLTLSQVRWLATIRYGHTPQDLLDMYPEEVFPQPTDALVRLISRGLVDGLTLTAAGREVCDWLFEADYESRARPRYPHQACCLRPLDAWIYAHRLLPEATQDLLRKRLRLMHSTFPKLKTDDVDGRAQAWLGISARRRGAEPVRVRPIEERAEQVCEVCHGGFKGYRNQVICGAECRAERRKAYMRMRRESRRRRLKPIDGWKYGDVETDFVDPYRRRL